MIKQLGQLSLKKSIISMTILIIPWFLLNRKQVLSLKCKERCRSGKKLLFKPNLVGPQVIDHDTHGEDLGAPICTDWSVIAALMRWFHDKLDINYHQMALGEASTSSLLSEVS